MPKNNLPCVTLLRVVCIFLMLVLMSIHTRAVSAEDRQAIKCEYKVNTLMRLRDVIQKTNTELGYLRNEIYARYGRAFHTPKYSAFFKKQSWYKINAEYSDDLLTSIDKQNVKLILSLEKPSKKDTALSSHVIKKKWKTITINNNKMKIVFARKRHCLVKGDFGFLPYVQEKGTVKGGWRVYNEHVYLWFNAPALYADEYYGNYIGKSKQTINEEIDTLHFKEI
jgi:hypothetical protein